MPPTGTWVEQIDKRTRNSKKHVDSANSKHFALDVTISSICYKDNPQDEAEQWKEIDNALESTSGPWDWQMLKAGYHIRVKNDFATGQIIEFEKQGETVQFQPMALEWTNDLDQIQQISMPQSVTPVITNPEVDLLPAVGMLSHQGTIRWNNGYGDWLDFQWQCTSTRLLKILQIESFSKLPIPAQYILDGGNPVLRLNLIFDPSGGTDIYVDGEVWNRKAKKQTFNIIEFRKGSEVLWGFMPLKYWGSGEDEDNEGQSVATLEKRGNKLYISIRVPYEWLQSAVYPVFIDIDVDEQVDADADDGLCWGVAWDATTFREGFFINAYTSAARWSVPVPKGATCISAYISRMVRTSNYGIDLKIITKVVNEDNCIVWDNATEKPVSKGFVSLGVNHDYLNSDWVGFSWENASIKASDLTAVFARAGWASGNYIGVCNFDNGSNDGVVFYDINDGIADRAAKTHIEYEEEVPGLENKSANMGSKMVAAGII